MKPGLSGLAILEHKLKLSQNHVPISTPGSPVLDNFPAGQVKHLVQGSSLVKLGLFLVSVMFPSLVSGKMYGPDCVGRLHKTLMKKAGLTENVTLHGLRHTYATLAIQNGVDVKTVSKILGHYSAGFTLDTYTHVTGEMQKEAADRMGGFMAQTR